MYEHGLILLETGVYTSANPPPTHTHDGYCSGNRTED